MRTEILADYLQGTLDDASSARVEAWIMASDENRKTIGELYALLFVSERIRERNAVDVGKMFADFQRRKSAGHSSARGNKPGVQWRRVASVAAAAVFIFLSATFASMALLDRNAQAVVLSTQLGERAQVVLPDGSKVWLNAFSSLEYKKSFLSRKRKATLSGEAYFEVAHNKRYPFVVSHEGSHIDVLGTKFNVRCNSDDDFLSATLLEGSIAFSGSGMRTLMKPGEELLFNKTSRETSVKTRVNPREVLGWIDGKLVFENASLEEIAKSLERHYNIHILFTDEKVKMERFNAEFGMKDNIYQILSILGLTNKFTYKIEREKREVIISQK